jgi:biotin operon repressor
MRSRKLLALDFVKHFIARWGTSPTLEELASELGVTRQGAWKLVQRLSDERQVDVLKGKSRGIRLIDQRETMSEADALLRLRQMGWAIGQDGRVVFPPGGSRLTEKRLTGLPELDHGPDLGIEDRAG